jgi:hypothetical protein
MPAITIIFGAIFIALGIAGFVLTGSEHVTALIPAFFGGAYCICGLAAMKPSLLKHAMHGAAMLGVLGFFGTVPGVIKLLKWAGGTAPERPAAVVSQSFMCALSVVFVALCVRSFIAARKARQAGFPVIPTP